MQFVYDRKKTCLGKCTVIDYLLKDFPKTIIPIVLFDDLIVSFLVHTMKQSKIKGYVFFFLRVEELLWEEMWVDNL